MPKLVRASAQSTWRGSVMLVLALTFVGVFFLPIFAKAQDPAAQNYGLTPGQEFGQVAIGQTSDLYGTIALIINIVLGFLGIVAVGLIMYAGWLWFTARGNEEQVKKAKALLRNAVIGLVIILSAWGIAAFVIRQLSDATGGGGVGSPCSIDSNSCVPDNSFCASDLFCSPSSCTCQYSGGGGGVGGEEFTLQEFQTGHVGSTNRDDVYLCSAVQARFNHWLDNTSVAGERANLKALITGVDNAHDGNYQSVPESQMTLDINSAGNVIGYRRVTGGTPSERENWPPYSQIEIRVPKAITDDATVPETLASCTAFGCNDNGDHYAWSFTTTDKTDAINPTLTSAYPRLPGSPEGYPDRNVDRSITFTLNFSEAIDYFSVVRADGRLEPSHVKVEQITYSVDQTIVAAIPIPTEDFDASLSETGVRFKLNTTYQSATNDGPYLEPFTWYRITVKDITDLCGNPLISTGGEVVWIFQTNGNIPGVEFTYPSDGYQFACPNTETFVQFRTSMYEIKTSSCAVDPTVGGLVLSGSGIDVRNLAVHDNLPTTGLVNPNNFCKRYDFAPPTAELVPNTTYNPKVDYRNPANDSLTVNQSWSFGVKPANECANAPYINRIDPGTGPFGRCLTIQGNYFGATKIPADDAYMTLDLESARNAITADAAGQAIRSAWTTLNGSGGIPAAISNSSWQNTYLTGVVPRPDNTTAQPLPPGTGGLADFKFSVKRSVTLGGAAQELKSNEVNFAAELSGSYTGPCLSRISPDSGAWGINVALSGTNFGASGDVTFTNEVNASVTDWRNTSIQSSVPNNCQSGDVKVTTSQGVSNGLPFVVANGAGAPCNTTADCAVPLVCLGGICTQPGETGRFEIRNPQPSAGCTDSCANAIISFETSKNIKPNTVTPANIQLSQCANDTCATGTPVPSGVTEPATLVNRVEFAKSLLRNQWYQVTILGGASGLAANSGELLSVPSYSWKFKTGGSVCGADRIDLAPVGGILYSNASYEYRARAYSIPNSCAASGQQVAANFAWGDAVRSATGTAQAECLFGAGPIGESRISMSPLSSAATSTVAVATFDSSDRVEHLAWVCARAGSTVAGASVTLKPRCTADSDCVIYSCDADSVCVVSCAAMCNQQSKICEPKITGFTPLDGGAIGTWVTINGCYLGNDWGEVKINNTNAIPPDNNFCANTWSNTQIIAEVAPGSESGFVEVKRLGDGLTANSNPDSIPTSFTVNATIHPGLCRAQPDYGHSGDELKLFGRNFGARGDPAQDKVIFVRDTSLIDVLDVRNWTDTASSAVITLAVPVVDSAGEWKIRVKKDARYSNSINFRVTESPSAGTGPGAKDLKVLAYTPGDGKLACPAMLVEVTLEGLVDRNSLVTGPVASTTPNSFIVKTAVGNEQLAGEVLAQNIDGQKTRLSFIPSRNLVFDKSYSIVLKGRAGGLRSQSRGQLVESALCNGEVLARSGECAISFSVIPNTDQAKNLCVPKSLMVEPANPIYTCAGEDNCPSDLEKTSSGNQQQFQARTLARNGQSVNMRAGYNWATSEATILNFSDDPTATSSVQILTVQPKNGSSIISADAVGVTIHGATEARVFLCDNPWPVLPDSGYFLPFKDTAANFSTFYCRDRGQASQDDDLPLLGDLKEFTSRQGVWGEDLIKEIFWIQPKSKKCQGGDKAGQACALDRDCGDAGQCVGKTDAIGIRVLKNLEHDSANVWYSRQSFIKGSPRAMKVDGYEALQDGRTVYVNAANDSDGDALAEPSTVYTNIYLISVNDSAQPDTQNIFKQMVDNWRFGANVSDIDNLAKLRRDAKRLADLRHLADLVETRINSNGSPPKLESGTFTKNLSVSVWPSWPSTLAPELGVSLPIDPLNTVNKDECVKQGAAADTCWNPIDKQFKCVADSFVYQYEYTATAVPNFTLRANLEYQSNSWAMPAGGRWVLTGAANFCENVRYGVDR